MVCSLSNVVLLVEKSQCEHLMGPFPLCDSVLCLSSADLLLARVIHLVHVVVGSKVFSETVVRLVLVSI